MEESEVNHDIIQENYIESYWNLTRKTVGQMKWKQGSFYRVSDNV